MNMTEQDWDIVLAEQQEAFEALVDDPRGSANGTEYWYGNGVSKRPAKEDNRNQLFDYIRVEKTTPKAKFFVTHETMTEIHGFWCPNTAIVCHKGGSHDKQVEVQHWCKVKTIQFI